MNMPNHLNFLVLANKKQNLFLNFDIFTRVSHEIKNEDFLLIKCSEYLICSVVMLLVVIQVILYIEIISYLRVFAFVSS